MKVKDAHMQAFPFIEPEQDDNIKAYHPGMTMRDEFAKAAMQSLILDSFYQATGREMGWAEFSKELSEEAYEVADAMMKARK